MRARPDRRAGALLLAAGLVGTMGWGLGAPAVHAATPVPGVRLQRVAKPVSATAFAVRSHDPSLYVTEQSGRVRAVRDGRLVTVLDMRTLVNQDGGERGLLGAAFSPDGAHLYVAYTDGGGDDAVDEFRMRGDTVVAGSRRQLLDVDDPQPNHNGGQLAFGPDGLLYIAFGDGGAQNDEGPGHEPGGNAQALDTLLGKIVRIDPTPSASLPYTVPPDNPFVGRAGARPEIWSYGLRNPWRFSFDADTGDLWIGDVGQGEWEEIDRVPATNGRNAGKGLNFGWNRLEGNHSFRGTPPRDAVGPVYEYSHAQGCAVTGGFVYRGTRIPVLRGSYVFADYCVTPINALVPAADGTIAAVNLGLSAQAVSSFGEGADLELYVLSQRDGLFRLVAR